MKFPIFHCPASSENGLTSNLPVLALLGLAVLPLIPAKSAWAETRALLIGIDQYRHEQVLNGAVNDAVMLSNALLGLGITDQVVLLDDEANRQSIMTEWENLIARSDEGDLLILTYAGHGGQEPEHVPGEEIDGKDETFFFGDFEQSGPGTKERILDNEIHVMLEQAAGRTVMVVADSCNSGTVTRAFRRGVSLKPSRYTDYDLGVDELELPDLEGTADDQDLEHVLFMAGVPDGKSVHEIVYEGEEHGALSVAVALALQGEGDMNGDGAISVGELQSAVGQRVSLLTDAQQTAQMELGSAIPTEQILFRLPNDAGAPTAEFQFPSLSLYVEGSIDPDVETLFAHEVIDPADSFDNAFLTWFRDQGDMVSSLRDSVSFPAGASVSTQLADVQGTMEKWSVVEAIKNHPATLGIRMSLAPSEKRYTPGEEVTLRAQGYSYPYLTIFNLDPFGGVNMVFPLAEYGDDPLAFQGGFPLEMPLVAGEPVGADHFVVIATPDQPFALQQSLMDLDGRKDVPALKAILVNNLEGKPFEMGLHGVFTSLN